MKTILCLSLLCAATAQAQYHSDWSEFDAGNHASQAAVTTHRGVFTGWLRRPMQSSNYAVQQGTPPTQSAPPVTTVPILSINRIGSDVRISWPASAANFVLQAKADLTEGSSWSNVPGPYPSNTTERFILAPTTQASQFYRLLPTP